VKPLRRFIETATMARMALFCRIETAMPKVLFVDFKQNKQDGQDGQCGYGKYRIGLFIIQFHDVPSLDLVRDGFADQARRSEDEDQDEEHKGEGIAIG